MVEVVKVFWCSKQTVNVTLSAESVKAVPLSSGLEHLFRIIDCFYFWLMWCVIIFSCDWHLVYSKLWGWSVTHRKMKVLTGTKNGSYLMPFKNKYPLYLVAHKTPKGSQRTINNHSFRHYKRKTSANIGNYIEVCWSLLVNHLTHAVPSTERDGC